MSIYVLMWRALCPSFSPIGNNYFSHLLYPCVSEIVRQGGFAEEPGYMPSTARGKLGQLPGTKLWHLSCSFAPPTLMLLLPSIPCYSCCPPSSTKSSSAPFFCLIVRFNTFDILASWAKRVNWGRSYCKFSIPFPEVGNVNIRFTNHHVAVHPRSSWQLYHVPHIDSIISKQAEAELILILYPNLPQIPLLSGIFCEILAVGLIFCWHHQLLINHWEGARVQKGGGGAPLWGHLIPASLTM